MKKDKSLNDEQNLAVYSRGSSILVSAPAGSGKTKILVNRMMSLIEDDHVSVDSLLVLTFTKAAALEMKQRLVESLNKRIHVVDDSLKVHLEKQKILLNDAYITNFHSFCSDLLSQYGYTIHLDSKFEILENPTLIKENILNQCLEKWVQEKEFYDFYQENYTGYQFNSFKEILFQLDNLSHTVYHFDDYLDQVKIKLYDRVINDQTIEDTPFEKPLKKLLHEAFQEAYDSYLKLEDYCQTYGLGFYFEETKKLPAPHTVLENYFQNLKECINQGKYFSMGIEIEKHRAASYKDVDDSIKETYKSLLDQTKNTFSKAYQKCMPSSIEELSEVLKVSYRHLEIYLKYLKEGGTIVANNYKMESVATTTGKAEYKVAEVDEKLKELHAKVINAADKATELGNAKVMNIILLGTVIKGMHLEDIDWEQIIKDNVKEKFVDINIKALHEGMALVS